MYTYILNFLQNESHIHIAYMQEMRRLHPLMNLEIEDVRRGFFQMLSVSHHREGALGHQNQICMNSRYCAQQVRFVG